MPSIPTFEFSSTTAKRLVILVADDAPAARATMQQWLEETGHTVLSASSGNEAIRIIKQQPVDLVITEVIMPNGDGLELILALKSVRPEARVIAVSGGGRYLPAADCLRVAKGLGAHVALPKPLGRDELLGAIDRLSVAVAAAVD